MKYLFAILLLISAPTLAESDYCAGYRVGYLMIYCHQDDRSCLSSDVYCRKHSGTTQVGMHDGIGDAKRKLSLELQLLLYLIREAKKEEEQ